MNYAIVHIADIHYQKDEPEGVSAIIKAFINDLKIQKELLKEYSFYLCITGDIVFKGNDVKSYTNFIKELDQPLNKIGITQNLRMIVPGNHDIDQDIVGKNIKKYQECIKDKIQSEKKFNDLISNKNFQDNKFDNYLLFQSEFAKYGIDYSLQGKGWSIDKDLSIFCLNTALCSFGGVNGIDDKNNLAIYTRGIIDWCNNDNNSIKILLMHHPITDLIKWSKDEIKQIIDCNFPLCLCGHNHEQDVSYNKITQKSLICYSPQLYTKKNDDLGYAIILIEQNIIKKIIYRQYVTNKFMPGQKFSESDDGVVTIKNSYLKAIDALESKLKNALAFFRDQPEIFIKPKLSESREFNNEENLLDQLIADPQSCLVVAHPQFGLTCLSHYMRLEAFKGGSFWIYIDAEHIKARNVDKEIENQLIVFEKKQSDIKCIIIDSWEGSSIDHVNILKCLDENYLDIPIIVMSNYTEFNFNSNFNFSKLTKSFKTLHLQALQRDMVRDFVSQYNNKNKIGNEDAVVTRVVKDLEVLNIHRTPLNCLTLLKVFEKDFNEDLLNRTKMIKAVLFILFTDADSFKYSSIKPDVQDCEYILGKFCKTLIEKAKRNFTLSDFFNNLEKYCHEKLITLDIRVLLDILMSNNIVIQYNNDELEFKHSYWIFYFASNYMLHDENFKEYILQNQTYVNFPEIIEFYTGLDGRRNDAIEILLRDLKEIGKKVDTKIGIPGNFNPLESVIWNPPEGTFEAIQRDILNRVNESNLPTSIKDQNADRSYNSEAPYDQSIKQFFNEYLVISLMQAIRASSRALRNSNYIRTELKKEFFQVILDGFELISKVIFLISPILAKKGSVAYEGLGLTLVGDAGNSFDEKLKNVFLSNPYNVVNFFRNDLSSKKIGPLICENLKNNNSILQKSLLSIFLIQERPLDWNSELFNFMNLLHRNSFILGNLSYILNLEITEGFVSESDLIKLKELLFIPLAKRKYSPKNEVKEIPTHMIINETNKLEIDKIMAVGKQKQRLKV